jgi:hypothetical protein
MEKDEHFKLKIHLQKMTVNILNIKSQFDKEFHDRIKKK